MLQTFIKEKFKDKVDKAGKPYIEHLYRVAIPFLVEPKLYYIALLHDIFEDTDVTEKVNIVSKLTDRTPEEVVNDTLWIQFQKVEDIPDEIDYDKIWGMLDHDKPEGDDVLDDLVRLGEEGWD